MRGTAESVRIIAFIRRYFHKFVTLDNARGRASHDIGIVSSRDSIQSIDNWSRVIIVSSSKSITRKVTLASEEVNFFTRYFERLMCIYIYIYIYICMYIYTWRFIGLLFVDHISHA